MRGAKKVAVVSGSSSGIGKETALLLARSGYGVVLTYHNGKKEGEAVLAECREHGEAVLAGTDVRDYASVQRLMDTALQTFGRVDMLINCAGVLQWTQLLRQSPLQIREQVETNLLGLINCTRAYLEGIGPRGKGVIVNIASGMGKDVAPELTVYCATKWGVRGFTQALALELPSRIRIYCVNPAMTATRMTGFRGEDPARVAEVIVGAAEERLGKKSGDDIDVWDYL